MIALLIAVTSVAVPAGPGSGPAAAQTISEYPLSGDPRPASIAAGPDGALWFTEINGNQIGRITTSGAVTEFPIPTANAVPVIIALGPDGALWFTELLGNRIGRITTSGTITEFLVSTAGSWPGGIAAGPDGALWFTEIRGNKIGRITTGGEVTEFPIPTANAGPFVIVVGPDGALWFTENYSNKIGRITTSGAITEYPIPTGDAGPDGITAGPDRALWFTEYNANKIGRITLSGAITEYPVPTANAGPRAIYTGPDGALWFTESLGNKIGRITIAGAITEYPVPTANAEPAGIVAGPDRALWFTETLANKIGRITTPSSAPTATPGLAPTAIAAPTASPPPGLATIGGRGLALRLGPPSLSWSGGNVQTGYYVVRIGASTTILPPGGLPLPASATQYTDTQTVRDPLVCYLVVPLVATGAPALSDLLCGLPGTRSRGGSPDAFTVRLNQSNTATLTWIAPGQVGNYNLIAVPLGPGAVPAQLPLPANATTTAHNTGGVPTCYVLQAQADGFTTGHTDIVCAVPGVSTFRTA